MTMHSHLIRSAQRSDCLLALLPCNNGCVINPMRPGGMYPVFNSSEKDSWIMKHGLITTENISILPQFFSSQAPAMKSYIATPLDFQKNTTSKTFIVKARCPKIGDGALHINPFITQGNHSGSAAQQVFQFALWENTSDTRLRGYISTENGVFAGTNVVLDNKVHDNFHVFAMTVDYDYTPDRTYIRLYWNGVQIGSSSLAKFSWYTPEPNNNLPNTVSIKLDTDPRYIANTQIAWSMIFDRVLTRSEIELFK